MKILPFIISKGMLINYVTQEGGSEINDKV